MATEQQYDEVIAPKLAEVARLCTELGMTLIARVEWLPDQYGITQVVPSDAGLGQLLTQAAAHADGNVDKLCFDLRRRFDCSQSIVLSRFGKD